MVRMAFAVLPQRNAASCVAPGMYHVMGFRYKLKITLQRLVFGGATTEFITIESSPLWKMFGTSFGANLK